MIGHVNWVEDKEVQPAIKIAKGKVQEALKPGKTIGGSRDENVGVAFEYPDAKVSISIPITLKITHLFVRATEVLPQLEKLLGRSSSQLFLERGWWICALLSTSRPCPRSYSMT